MAVSLRRHRLIAREQLLDRCLAAVDRELFEHLRSKNLSAELYAFPCGSARTYRGERSPLIPTFPAVMTFCAGTPPLDQVLRLWEWACCGSPRGCVAEAFHARLAPRSFLLAFGVHLNILCVIAQMLIMRQDLLDSASCVLDPPFRAPVTAPLTTRRTAAAR